MAWLRSFPWVVSIVASACGGAPITVDDAGGTAGTSGSTGGGIMTTPVSDATGRMTIDDGDEFDDGVFDDFVGLGDLPSQPVCPQVQTIWGPGNVDTTIELVDVHGEGIAEPIVIADLGESPEGVEQTLLQVLIPPFEGDIWAVAFELPFSGGYEGFHDIDGDGLRDLIVRAPSGPMGYPFMFHRALSPMDYTFGEAPEPILNPAQSQINFIQLDNDAFVDILAVPDVGESMQAWFGDGVGGFIADVTLAYPEAVGVQVGDAREAAWFVAIPTYFGDFGCANSIVNSVQLFPGGALEGIVSEEGQYAQVLQGSDLDANGFVDAYVRVCEDPPSETEGFALLTATAEGMTLTYELAGLGWAAAADIDGDADVDIVWADVAGSIAFDLAEGGTIIGTQSGAGDVAIPGAHAVDFGDPFGDGHEAVALTARDDAGRYFQLVTAGPCR